MCVCVGVCVCVCACPASWYAWPAVCVCVWEQVITGTAALIPLKTDDPGFTQTVCAADQLVQTHTHTPIHESAPVCVCVCVCVCASFCLCVFEITIYGLCQGEILF